MDENYRRRLSISVELMTWGDALASLLAKIDELLKSREITVAQAAEVETIADNVGIVIRGIGETVRTDD
jgi:hypothetical protein